MSGLLISAVVLSISISILVFCIVFILLFHIGAERRQVSARVSKFTEKPKSAMYSIKNKKHKPGNTTPNISKIKLLDIIGNELLLANILIKPEEFLVLWLIVIFVPAGLVILFTSELIPSVTLIVLGVLLPPAYIRNQKKKRTAKFESQLGDALIVIGNCIRSGLTFQQAMETISNEMDAPIGQEFTRVVREIRYGNNLEKALNNMASRVGSVDLMLAVSAVNIQRQTGGNLSVILGNISTTIKERQKIKDDIRVLTATGRISGAVYR